MGTTRKTSTQTDFQKTSIRRAHWIKTPSDKTAMKHTQQPRSLSTRPSLPGVLRVGRDRGFCRPMKQINTPEMRLMIQDWRLAVQTGSAGVASVIASMIEESAAEIRMKNTATKIRNRSASPDDEPMTSQEV